MLLGEFFDKYVLKMQKYKFYKIVVSGKLSFEQDLIQSKIVSEVTAGNRIRNFSTLEIGEQVIPTDFVMLRKEIINGSITDSTWEILKKVCSTKEMTEIWNLVVVSAIYHFDEDACFTIEEFLDSVLADIR